MTKMNADRSDPFLFILFFLSFYLELFSPQTLFMCVCVVNCWSDLWDGDGDGDWDGDGGGPLHKQTNQQTHQTKTMMTRQKKQHIFFIPPLLFVNNPSSSVFFPKCHPFCFFPVCLVRIESNSFFFGIQSILSLFPTVFFFLLFFFLGRLSLSSSSISPCFLLLLLFVSSSCCC